MQSLHNIYKDHITCKQGRDHQLDCFQGHGLAEIQKRGRTHVAAPAELFPPFPPPEIVVSVGDTDELVLVADIGSIDRGRLQRERAAVAQSNDSADSAQLGPAAV